MAMGGRVIGMCAGLLEARPVSDLQIEVLQCHSLVCMQFAVCSSLQPL